MREIQSEVEGERERQRERERGRERERLCLGSCKDMRRAVPDKSRNWDSIHIGFGFPMQSRPSYRDEVQSCH